jgi:hypothetical protein
MLIPISNWPTLRIGVGSLLLVVSHIIAVPVLVLWVALKKKKLNLDARNICAGSYTEHYWRCSKLVDQ